MPKVVLVDAHGYLHRAYHALPALTTKNGQPIGALYGFARMIWRLMQEEKPEYMAVCFDPPGETFRKKLFPDYKAKRKEIDPELRAQLPASRDLVAAFGLAQFEKSGFEADDILATLTAAAKKAGHEVLLVTGDKDMLQLVEDGVAVLSEPRHVKMHAAEVEEKWGVAPKQIRDLLALMGDTSDNVPGLPGVGEKTAAKLIQEFGSLDAILQLPESLPTKIREKIIDHKDVLLMSAELVSLKSDVALDVDWEKMKTPHAGGEILDRALAGFEFFSLLKDLREKNYFMGEVQSAASPGGADHQYKTVLTLAELDSLAQQMRDAQAIVVDVETTGLNPRKAEWVGMAIATQKNEGFYIPMGHRYLGAPEQLSVEVVREKLGPILENAKIAKIGHNLKFDAAILKEAGIVLSPLSFDTLVAAYVLDPSRPSYGLKDLAQSQLNFTMTRLEEISIVKAKDGYFPMDQVEVEKAAPYAAADACATFELYELFSSEIAAKKLEKLFYDVEMPLVGVLQQMEEAGVALDEAYLKNLGEEFRRELKTTEKKVWELVGYEFNLASSKQVGTALFDKLGLPPVKKTKTGYSTDEEVLKILAAKSEVPQLLLRHRELSKLASTYVDGLLSEIDETTTRVHTHFQQAGTATGRLSSTEPNLQNIPIRTEEGRKIRRAFVPSAGCIFVSADYSQIDLRVLAHLSKDEALIEAFKKGEDIHRSTAAEVFHKTLGEVTDEERSRAKAINFGIVYGQQSFGLSQQLGISMAEAADLIRRYFERFAGVKRWMDQVIVEAKKTGGAQTILGRVRKIPELSSKNGAMRGFAERVAMNTPVQGSSADIIKLAMIELDRALKKQNWKVSVLLQIHDDLLCEVEKNHADDFAALLRQTMESAIQLSVPLKVDIKTGPNWAELKKL